MRHSRMMGDGDPLKHSRETVNDRDDLLNNLARKLARILRTKFYWDPKKGRFMLVQ